MNDKASVLTSMGACCTPKTTRLASGSKEASADGEK